jgi:hypothetical protein
VQPSDRTVRIVMIVVAVLVIAGLIFSSIRFAI